ncbi:hypothetical protein LMH87_012344 [Akanthomyces muscarius]|uniref:N-acetyltransferase domain-containing protein n=1 Tax=Akanthomyces muscarius TaxID=2231603 RepID=A0A9W8UM19_AKAMU|nr:hypothetical protein LMH87_012344 [Akanthomyces muscarius]KAJ4151655.1 hypothetical protein LMH87_012344 [Akanthomyces muscarius]
MASDYVLIPHCTVDDGVGLSQAKTESFVKEPWWTSEFPPDRQETILDSMILREPYNQLTARNIRRHQKVIHVPTGEIVGYSRWFVPNPDDWLEAQTPAVSEEEEAHWKLQYNTAYWHFVEDGQGTDDHVSAWRAAHTPTGPVISLEYLCCKQSHQKRGVASLLIRSGCEQADKLKLPITIYAMGEKARDAYLKHGFQQLAEKHQDLRPFRDCVYHTYWMVRHPQ